MTPTDKAEYEKALSSKPSTGNPRPIDTMLSSVRGQINKGRDPSSTIITEDTTPEGTAPEEKDPIAKYNEKLGTIEINLEAIKSQIDSISNQLKQHGV